MKSFQELEKEAHKVAMIVVRQGGVDVFPDPGDAVNRITKALAAFAWEQRMDAR